LGTHFSSSRLVRLVGPWAPAPAEPPATDFAERLSLWVSAFDAIGLQAAQRAIEGIRTAAPRAAGESRAMRSHELQEDLQRARGALSKAIAQPLEMPETGYAAYRQRHLELQRQMELVIAPLRDHVRQALARVSPGLRKLAALDAVLEQLLAPREQSLLPRVAALLQRRFDQLQREHRRELQAGGLEDDPALWHRPGGWLERFEQDWREALRAEVDLRLEPVAGLVEALGNALKKEA
jgi:hypothetical protein